MDPFSAFTMTFGIILLLSSWVYLGFVAFEKDFSWGLCTIFLPVLGYLYAFFSWEEGKAPLALAGLGWLCVLLAIW